MGTINSFTNGTIVRLKSGGPKMTVVSLNMANGAEKAEFNCVYFIDNKEKHEHGFRPECLEIVKDPGLHPDKVAYYKHLQDKVDKRLDEDIAKWKAELAEKAASEAKSKAKDNAEAND